MVCRGVLDSLLARYSHRVARVDVSPVGERRKPERHRGFLFLSLSIFFYGSHFLLYCVYLSLCWGSVEVVVCAAPRRPRLGWYILILGGFESDRFFFVGCGWCFFCVFLVGWFCFFVGVVVLVFLLFCVLVVCGGLCGVFCVLVCVVGSYVFCACVFLLFGLDGGGVMICS